MAVLVTTALAVGCRAPRTVYDPEYAQILSDVRSACGEPVVVASAIGGVADELAGPQPVETFVCFALAQNPRIHAARKQLEARAFQVPQAGSLQDPTLGITTYGEPVQTAAGQQELLIAANQKLPWFGKLRAQAEMAQWNVQAAQAQLAAVELSVVEEVKRAYYELYFVQQALRITADDRALLVDLTKIAEAKYRTGTVSQQDVLRAQLEVSNLDKQLIQLRQQLASTRARLARRLHLSPDTPLQALDALEAEQIPGDLDALYHQAISARPELQAQLAAVDRDRRAVDRAQLDYFPDVTLGLTWISTSTAGISPVANGHDPLTLGVSFNMPIYRDRIEAGVREAEAQTVADARRYDALRDETLERVTDLFAQARSQQQLRQLFQEEILPKADQTLRVSVRAYQTGDVDFLQLIDNWRQLLRFQLAHQRLESQLRQTLAGLERMVGGCALQGTGELDSPPPADPPLPEPLPRIPAAGP